MARPKGKQIAVTCGVCGTIRHWPPSKAAGKKYCSTKCRDRGRELVTDWDWIAGGASVIYRMPDRSDPMGRGVIADDRVFLRVDDGWQELVLQRNTHSAGFRVVERVPIDAAEIPAPTAETPHATTEATE
ncbi:hypothetical protein Enr13x_12560 [Stieleria neptunia]|uniref:Uncharacterized protein n=1 Tax=Stieleria neptunia TaxID=2527979 RepID=A0A518HKP5_9BACT|nr:hypothetical protein [Stieleria neptunia]QDV41417.1 hypothetical protein Enr13x_12560 [Stieleria neptunia]